MERDNAKSRREFLKETVGTGIAILGAADNILNLRQLQNRAEESSRKWRRSLVGEGNPPTEEDFKNYQKEGKITSIRGIIDNSLIVAGVIYAIKHKPK
jgi:hypothetical protein